MIPNGQAKTDGVAVGEASQWSGVPATKLHVQKGDSVKLSRFAPLAIFTLMLVIGVCPNALADNCSQTLQAPVNAVGDSGIQGTAQICIQGNSITATMRTQGLVATNAYTIWFVYFDNPSLCGFYASGTPGVCTGMDLITPANNPVGVFGRMDGTVAEASGVARFTGRFRGLQFSHGSAIHLAMFGHGPASTTDNRFLARQLLTPQRPPLGPPGEGTPDDGAVGKLVAAAVFSLP